MAADYDIPDVTEGGDDPSPVEWANNYVKPDLIDLNQRAPVFYTNIAALDNAVPGNEGWVLPPTSPVNSFGANPGLNSFTNGWVRVKTSIQDDGFEGSLTPPFGDYTVMEQYATFFLYEKEFNWYRTRYSLSDGSGGFGSWGAWAAIARPLFTPNPLSIQTGNYVILGTGASTDVSRGVMTTAATAVSVEVADSSTVPIGTTAKIIQGGAGAVTISGFGSVVIRNPFGVNTLREQYSVAFVTKIALNEWVLWGDLASSVTE